MSHHVKLTVEGIDRMYLNIYVPRLQCETGIVGFFRHHRGNPLPSSALMKPMSREFVAKLEKFVAEHQIPLVQFHKGQRKDDVMKQHLRQFRKDEGILFVGKAQEKTPVFRTERRRSPKTGQPYPWIVRSTAMVNNYYIYAFDRDFGPFFLKFCSYFPFNAKLCLNGHEYAKRQLVREGIKFEALDNGVLSCANPKRLQKLCDGLSAEKIDGLLRKWLRLLPHPFTGADRQAGYRYCCATIWMGRGGRVKSSFTGAASLARTLIDAARQSVFGCFGVFGCGVDGWPAGSALSIEGFAAAIAFDIHFQDRGMMHETVDCRERHGMVREEFASFAERLVGRYQH